ncbi:hypothetical protein EVAR_43080_1 [Eumeta japonica]|uniref:Uncharacterized protein n=1 Tax=Eumeta variegata TaxID=151549 RepID=A0A4C1WZ45_EUMVA|nr:hypothetical protein EVAR_43080_1 [Eumeta japonica]
MESIAWPTIGREVHPRSKFAVERTLPRSRSTSCFYSCRPAVIKGSVAPENVTSTLSQLVRLRIGEVSHAAEHQHRQVDPDAEISYLPYSLLRN